MHNLRVNRITSLLCVCSDHNSGKSSLDTLLALLQAEGAKIEEETEVKLVLQSIYPYQDNCKSAKYNLNQPVK